MEAAHTDEHVILPDALVAPDVSQRDNTVFAVLIAISFCHLLNDMMQSLLPAIYPNLKVQFGLSFVQVGLVTFAYQITASLLQPLVGLYADRRPTPLALPGGTLFTLAGLTILSIAQSYDGQATRGILVLLILVFSKYVYLASLTSYYTFYLIHRFDLSIESAQMHLFVFLAAVAAGTLIGGPIGDRFGRRYVIWFSILGALPFTLLLPAANLFWTGPLTVVIGLILASAFPAIVVFAQDLVPGKVGMISGLFFGFSFGMAGLGAAVLGWLADRTSIETVYRVCAFLPAIGMLAAWLPKVEHLNAKH